MKLTLTTDWTPRTYAACTLFHAHAALPFLLLLFVAFLFPASEAFAHRVNVFAWVSGNTVHVEGRFSRSQPAREARITVYNGKNEKVLAQGTSSTTGDWSFPVPIEAKTDGLLIELDAGEGHRNTWSMPADEFQKAQPDESRETKTSSSQNTQTAEKSKTVETSGPATEQSRLLTGELRHIVREEMAEAVAPLEKRLAELAVREPGLTEILGGIGWLIGMFGLFAALKAKIRRSEH